MISKLGGGTTFDCAFLHQTVVVVHLKVAFYLLQCIKNYTYHNQQRCAAEELGEVL